MNPAVDKYLSKTQTWPAVMKRLRKILLASPLTEELKWGKPCYTFQDSNVAIIQGFKDYCALMFFKGALLKDPKGVLHKPGASSQAARRFHFASVREVGDMEAVVKAYIREAITLEKSGSTVKFKKNPEPIPAELKDKFGKKPAFKKAFEALTPGRQRAYILYFSAAKQSTTRQARIEKCMPQILEGRGLNDR